MCEKSDVCTPKRILHSSILFANKVERRSSIERNHSKWNANSIFSYVREIVVYWNCIVVDWDWSRSIREQGTPLEYEKQSRNQIVNCEQCDVQCNANEWRAGEFRIHGQRPSTKTFFWYISLIYHSPWYYYNIVFKAFHWDWFKLSEFIIVLKCTCAYRLKLKIRISGGYTKDRYCSFTNKAKW